MGGRLDDRPTSDIVVLILATIIGITVLLAGLGIVLVELIRPEVDTSESVAAFSDVVSAIVGAVVGYLAGKRNPDPVTHPGPGSDAAPTI